MYDIDGKMGDPIKPFREGTVTFRSWDKRGFGYTVRIRDKNGNVYQYSHLADFGHIKPGDKVDTNTVIGFMGNSGVTYDLGGHRIPGTNSESGFRAQKIKDRNGRWIDKPGTHLHFDVEDSHGRFVDPASV